MFTSSQTIKYQPNSLTAKYNHSITKRQLYYTENTLSSGMNSPSMEHPKDTESLVKVETFVVGNLGILQYINPPTTKYTKN